MPVFAFRALDVGGRDERGVIDAESPRGAWQHLRRRGLYPTQLELARPEPRHFLRTRVRPAEFATVLRQLATLVQAGVPVAEALEVTAEGASPVLRHALVTTRARVRDGAPLADALAISPDTFPPVLRALVQAAEATGTLPAVLDRLAAHAENSAALRARLRAACTYPAVMLGTTLLVLGFLLMEVMPQIAELFAETGTPLPLATRALLGAVAVVEHTWWVAFVVGIAGGMGLRRWLGTRAGRTRFDRLVLQLPALGPLAGRAATARLVRTLATVLASGVPLERGLGLAGEAAGNTVFEDAARAACDAVRRGEPLAAALARTGIFSPLLIRVAATGERGGALVSALARAADSADEEVSAAIGTATRLLEPLLVLVVGAAVLVLVLAILVPVLTLQPAGLP